MATGLDRYYLFAGHRHYPNGGALDYRMSGTMEECKGWFAANAREIADGNYIDNWGQIVDPQTMAVVLYGEQVYSPGGYDEPSPAVWSAQDPDQ